MLSDTEDLEQQYQVWECGCSCKMGTTCDEKLSLQRVTSVRRKKVQHNQCTCATNNQENDIARWSWKARIKKIIPQSPLNNFHHLIKSFLLVLNIIVIPTTLSETLSSKEWKQTMNK